MCRRNLIKYLKSKPHQNIKFCIFYSFSKLRLFYLFLDGWGGRRLIRECRIRKHRNHGCRLIRLSGYIQKSKCLKFKPIFHLFITRNVSSFWSILHTIIKINNLQNYSIHFFFITRLRLTTRFPSIRMTSSPTSKWWKFSNLFSLGRLA